MSWENSAPTLRPLPDHVIVCSTGGFGDVVGEFRTNIAAIAGSCDCVQLGVLGDVVGEFRTNVAAIAGSCDVIGNWGLGESWDNSAPTLWPFPIM